MKKYLIFASAALVALAACNKEVEIQEPANNTDEVVLTFTSERPQFEAGTKTAWDATNSCIVWESTDKIRVGYTLNGNWMGQTEAGTAKFYASKEVTIDDDTDSSVGTFQVPITGSGVTAFTDPGTNGTYKFYSIYPHSILSNTTVNDPTSQSITLATTQTPGANTFDHSTDIMVGVTDNMSIAGLPTDPIELNWNRVVAHAALTFSNMNFDGTETPSKITLTFNEDAKVAGDFSINITDGSITEGTENVIALEGSGLTVTDNSISAWATVLPVSFTSLNVEIKTNKATYTRSISDLDKTFKKNARNTLKINMSTADREAATEEYEWVKKDLSAITDSDVFVIVGNNGDNYAMSNDKGTSAAPEAVSVSIADDKLSSEPVDKIQWNLSVDGSNYTFYPNGTTETWLYCTNTNNGVRVGTNSNSVFTIDSGYLKNSATSRYVGVYNSSDWRCYTSNTGTSNIANQNFAFYVKTVAAPSKPKPTISFDNPTTEVNIDDVVANVATISVEGLTVTYSSSNEEIALVDEETGEVLGVAAGTATITASFAGDDNYDAASAEYVITVVDPNANDGSEEKPYTASEAIAIAQNLGSNTQDVYVKGIVCTPGSVNTEYNSVTYFISDDGTTSSRLQIYSGKYIDNADFTDENNLKKGDYVVVHGTLKYYNNSTPEIDKNSVIQTIFRAPTFSPNGGSFTTESTTVEINAESGATIYFTLDESDPTTESDVYDGVITITETTTIKAIAVKNSVSTGVSSVTFTKINNTDVLYSLYSGTLTEGDYVIVYSGKAMKNTVANNRLGYAEVTVSGNDIANPDASIVWHIAPSGDYWTIYNEDVSSYAAGNGTKNQGALVDTIEDASLWTASGSSTFEFVNKKNSAANVNANLRNNGTYGFACYGTGTGGALSLYKKN